MAVLLSLVLLVHVSQYVSPHRKKRKEKNEEKKGALIEARLVVPGPLRALSSEIVLVLA